jgi:hypothetical protein
MSGQFLAAYGQGVHTVRVHSTWGQGGHHGGIGDSTVAVTMALTLLQGVFFSLLNFGFFC